VYALAGPSLITNPLTIQLMVENRVEGFESRLRIHKPSPFIDSENSQIVHQSRVTLICQQEIGRRESLEQLHQSRRSLNSDILDVRRHIRDADGQSREKWIQSWGRGDGVD